MKNIILLFTFLIISFEGYSQILSINGDGFGTIDISYDPSLEVDPRIYDSYGESIYLYIWIETFMNDENTFYGDDWSGTLTEFPWNPVTSKHEVSINLNNYNFATGGIIPTGTTITNFMFIMRNSIGSNQSANLTASDYLFTSAVLPVEEQTLVSTNIFSYQNSLFVTGLSNTSYDLTIFDTMGRTVKQVKSNENQLDISSLQNGLYFVALESAEGGLVKKKILKQ
ncbi:hypothetical protein KH5_11410 [Urechidicola sp. KH5]